jgi:hypothetical protein
MQRNYSFKDIILLLGGVQSYGHADGDDCIMHERVEDVSTYKIGADGWGTIAKNASTAIKITLKYLDTSPFNAVLQNILSSMDALGIIIPISYYLKDLSGLDLVQAPQAVISKSTTIPFGKGPNIRSWELISINPIMYAGGHPII